jgi:hypothetical protein
MQAHNENDELAAKAAAAIITPMDTASSGPNKPSTVPAFGETVTATELSKALQCAITATLIERAMRDGYVRAVVTPSGPAIPRAEAEAILRAIPPKDRLTDYMMAMETRDQMTRMNGKTPVFPQLSSTVPAWAVQHLRSRWVIHVRRAALDYGR